MVRFVLGSLIFVCGLVGAAEWSGFRGPDGSGLADTSGLPQEFGPAANVVWSVPAPAGSSSPVLTRDHIFLTGFAGDKLLTFCLDRASGKTLWHRELVKSRTQVKHKLNNSASSTPATDGQNVYVFFPEFGLVSYSGDGAERWRMPLGPFASLHGMAASPVLFEDKLILVIDQDTDSQIFAADKDTGRILWKTGRPEVVHGFATPTIFRMPGEPPQIIVPGSYQVEAYSPSDGHKIWWVRGLTWQIKPSAVVSADTVFASGWAPGADAGQRQSLPPFEQVLKEADQNGDHKISREEIPAKYKPGGSWEMIDLDRDGLLDHREWDFYRARRSAQNVILAIRPGKAAGDLTDTPHVLWSYDRSVPQVPSPLLYKGILYSVKDGGILTAFDAEKGSVLKQARLRGAIDAYFASPVAADNKLFFISETGKVSVVSPGAEWETLALNDLDDQCYATPAISNGRIYLRTKSTLYCFGK